MASLGAAATTRPARAVLLTQPRTHKSTITAAMLCTSSGPARLPYATTPLHSVQQHRMWRHCVPRSSCAVAAAAGQGSLEESCIVPFITADNTSNEKFTILDVEMPEIPGLLRTTAWVLNGLDMVAHNAIVRTSPEGISHNTFWLLTRKGKKLSDEKAELLSDRVREFLVRCGEAHVQRPQNAQFTCGPIGVSNVQHPEYTLVRVVEAKPTPGFLLDVASVLSGLNHDIKQALIEGQPKPGSNSGPAAPVDWQWGDGGRQFEFWLLNSKGQKLDDKEISALVFVLSRCLGYRTHPTVPPDAEVLLSAQTGEVC